jgi:transcription-repair coupling factor (superfamily II helicase)
MKDLEMRGAGNLLGAQQSGFVQAVGLDAYTRLLEDTIKRMKGGVAVEREPTDVTMEGAAYLPDDYIADPAQKLHLYRRLSRVEHVAEVLALHAELRDRFGPPPLEVQRLLMAARLRLSGTAAGVERIQISGTAARVTFAAATSPRMLDLQKAFRDHQVEVELKRSIPLSIILRQAGAVPVADMLADALDGLIGQRRGAAA